MYRCAQVNRRPEKVRHKHVSVTSKVSTAQADKQLFPPIELRTFLTYTNSTLPVGASASMKHDLLLGRPMAFLEFLT